MRSSIAQAAVVGLILLNQAFAEPLDVHQVSASANWLVHIDGDAVRRSIIAQKTWEAILEKHEDLESHMQIAKMVIGLDPFSDIRGITMYGNCHTDSNAVTIVTASMDVARLESVLSFIPDRKMTTHGDYHLHHWVVDFKKPLDVVVAFRGHDQLVLATSIDQVKTELAVLDGMAPGLADDSPLVGDIAAGTTFLARFAGTEPSADADGDSIEEHSSKEHSKKKYATAFRFAIGEDQGESFCHLRVTMAEPKAVGRTLSAIHGTQAIFCLACKDDLWRKLVSELSSKCDGQTLMVSWSAPANDILDGLTTIQEHLHQRHLEHKQKHPGHKHKSSGEPADADAPDKCESPDSKGDSPDTGSLGKPAK